MAPWAPTFGLDQEVQVWRIPLDVEADAQAEAMDFLSPDERERAAAFLRPVDRARWPLARAGMRRILAGQLDRAPGALVFQTEGNEKPCLPGSGDLAFNLSHSNGWALLALARGAAVGVDVEWLRPLPELEGMLTRILTPGEWAALPRLGRDAVFFRTWVHKEALVKGMGVGLYRDPTSLPLEFDARGDAHAEGWVSRPVSVPSGYLAAVAVPGPARVVEMRDGPNCQGHPPFPP